MAIPDIVDANGGLKSDSQLPALRDLCSKASKGSDRVLILLVLKETKGSILNRFANDYEGIATLDSWLQQTKQDAKHKHTLLILSVLTQFTMSLQLLKETTIGKTVNKLTKMTENAEIVTKSKALVQKWKKSAAAENEPPKPAPTTCSLPSLCYTS